MGIRLDSNIREDLVKFKLKNIQDKIQMILNKWHEFNIDDFIKKTKTGELPDAELDAITIKQLVKDLESLRKLLKQIKVENS
ncbi:MAG: hypothetical protein ACTSYB_14565 [Candidatus Helarchaeota archaeon]